MTKQLFLAAMALALLAPALASAQTPDAAPPPDGASPAPGVYVKHPHPPMDLNTRKQKILDHMAKKQQEMQARQACVQNAQTEDALKACKPPHDHKHM